MSQQSWLPATASGAIYPLISLLIPPPFSNLGLGSREQSQKEDNAKVNPPSLCGMPRSTKMMTTKERVAARNKLLRSNVDLFGEGSSSAATQRKLDVSVKRGSDILDFGLFNSLARMDLEVTKRPSNSRDVGPSSGDPNAVRLISLGDNLEVNIYYMLINPNITNKQDFPQSRC
jgi:hypothetical protein